MKLKFEVGTQDKYIVEFCFDKFWGTIALKVNEKTAARYFMMFGGRKRCMCNAGRYNIEVDIIQPLFFAFLRKRTYNAYVDGILFKIFNSKGKEIKLE